MRYTSITFCIIHCPIACITNTLPSNLLVLHYTRGSQHFGAQRWRCQSLSTSVSSRGPVITVMLWTLTVGWVWIRGGDGTRLARFLIKSYNSASLHKMFEYLPTKQNLCLDIPFDIYCVSLFGSKESLIFEETVMFKL